MGEMKYVVPNVLGLKESAMFFLRYVYEPEYAHEGNRSYG